MLEKKINKALEEHYKRTILSDAINRIGFDKVHSVSFWGWAEDCLEGWLEADHYEGVVTLDLYFSDPEYAIYYSGCAGPYWGTNKARREHPENFD